ncbi:MAG: His-Xaa-Ser system protein HxsD [Deltaproteobacteria bacterium]
MTITVNSKLYPLEAILNACYAFIDRAYFFLDEDPRHPHLIRVAIKMKKGTGNGKADALRDQFNNELLHCSLRHRVSKANKRIREYIIGRALYFVSPIQEGTPTESLPYADDPLHIAKPWEERYGRKKGVSTKI